MNIKLPCEIVEDILPSYVDGLTNTITNEAVQEHLKECEGCRGKLQAMREPDNFGPANNEADKKEINYLKKTRRRHVGAIIGAAVGVFLLAFGYYIFASFNGSIIKKAQLTGEAKKYVATNFSDRTDLTVSDATFDWKFGKYYCMVQSDTSVDTTFRVYYDKDGLTDDYKESVLSGSNTQIRLMSELSKAADEKLLADYPFRNRLFLAKYSDTEPIDCSKLVLDMSLDMTNPVAPMELSVWVETSNNIPTWKELKDVLRKTYAYTEAKGVHFSYFSIWLEYPYTLENEELRPTQFGSTIYVNEVPCDIINDEEALDAFIEAFIEKEATETTK